jgi:mRNA interferase RelE/StbE
MYRVIVSDKAKRQLEKFEGDIRDRIGRSIERLKIRPFSFVKKLVGSKYFSLRAGDYRVILDINKGDLIILVVEVGHRKKIYKK